MLGDELRHGNLRDTAGALLDYDQIVEILVAANQLGRDMHGIRELLRPRAFGVHVLHHGHSQGVFYGKLVQHAVDRQTHLGDAEKAA